MCPPALVSAGPRRRGGLWSPAGCQLFGWRITAELPAGQCTPPFSFRSCRKGKRAVHGPKEKNAFRRTPVQWPSARTGDGVPGASVFSMALCRARLGLLRFPILPSRGGWCRRHRGGRRMASAPLFAAAGLAVGDGSSVGADLCVRPLRFPPDLLQKSGGPQNAVRLFLIGAIIPPARACQTAGLGVAPEVILRQAGDVIGQRAGKIAALVDVHL